MSHRVGAQAAGLADLQAEPREADDHIGLGARGLKNQGVRGRGGSPVPERAVVLQAVDRQVLALVGVLRGELLVDIHAVAGRLARVQHALVEGVGMREDGVGLLGVRHVFLDAEVGHPEVEVQRRAHAHR